MKFSIFFTVLAFTAWTAPAGAMSFKASIQPLKLPLLLSDSQPPKVKFTPPGEIAVGMMRMCGDGDVADFSSEHSNFEFVPQNVNELDVLLGYWVVEEGQSPVPTSNNFYTVGYRKSAIANSPGDVSYKGNFIPMNKSTSPGPNGLNLIATDLINLQRIAERSYGSQKNYRIFAGAFTCLNPDQGAALADPKSIHFDYNPSPVEIGHVLSTQQSSGLLRKATKALDDLDTSDESSVKSFAKDNDRVSYKADKSETIYKSSVYEATNQSPIKFDIGNYGDVKISQANILWDLFKDIASLNYPSSSSLPEDATTEAKLENYKKKLSETGVASKLSGIPGAGEGYCTAMGLTVNSSAPQYKWEAFPMNLSCKYFLNNTELEDSYTKLFNPKLLPAESDFKALKKALASRFYIAAVFHTVQKTMHADSKVKIERPNCFNLSGKPMISRVVGSFPFQFSYNATDKNYKINAAYQHVHPEPLFALVDYRRYFDSDTVGLWGQVLSPDESLKVDPTYWGIKFPLKDKTMNSHLIDSKTFNDSPINIFFKIRSVGGSCPMFC